MIIERKKNAKRNIITGIIHKVYILAVPFLIRTLMIYFMGVQYLGLNSLFASILQVLNLMELGVGSAMVYSMYQPIAEDNEEKLCELLNMYKKYYRIIGLFILIIGLMILPFIHYLIDAESLASLPSDINVYILYLLNLVATLFTYWLFSYRNSLLLAFQRNDIINKISIVFSSIQYCLQIIIICLFKNYYLFVITTIITQLLINIATYLVTKKMFPRLKEKGELSKEERRDINQRIKDLFTAKIGSVVVNSVDSIIISAFLGLTVLAIYQNYFYILSAVMGIISIILNSCAAGIGNSLIVENKEKNYLDFQKITFILSWIICFCTCCLLCLYQPFMEIWVGKELMFDMTIVVFFCLYFFIQSYNTLFNLYKDSAGIWHSDRFRPLTVALLNLLFNLLLVNYIGIYGVLGSTFIISLIVGIPWILVNVFKKIFTLNLIKQYLFSLFKYLCISIAVCLGTYFLCIFIQIDNNYLSLLVKMMLCMIVPNVTYFLCFKKSSIFHLCINTVMNLLPNKLSKLVRKVFKYDSN